MDDLDPARGEWQQIYHDRRWSSLLIDVGDFAVAFLAALIGLTTIFFTITALAGAARAQSVNVTGVWWLDDAIVLAIAAAFAWWGLSAIRRFLIDVTRPALIDEGRVDAVGVHMASGSHGGYRVWTMTCGSKSWSMPYLDGKRFLHMVEPGMMVRVRYRPGTWSIADLWIFCQGRGE
jgi:hypothetical protein